MSNFFNIDNKLLDAEKKALKKCEKAFLERDKITEYNQEKMLSAFIKNHVSESHFAASTGYGTGDRGREVLEKVFADCIGAESAIFRHNFVSGTHALTVGLFGILRPNDTFLCLTGRPYDTLVGVLGIDKKVDGSLEDFGINYEQVDLKSDGSLDLEEIETRLKAKKYKMAYIQRSRGYSLRPSLSVEKIGEAVKLVKSIAPETIVFVDNCYGEFVEMNEPLSVGADLIVGSLIKNPGGAIAPTGGYIAGKEKFVEQCGYRLTAPGVGLELGATLGHTRELFMGLFNAPHVVGEALKTAIFASAFFSELGFEVTPTYDEPRADIIQAVLTGNEKSLIAFCKGMQSGAPIDSFVSPEPCPTPGYDCDIIMAAGAFTLGASIELSADAPLREPYAVWMQGGINFHSAKMGILLAAQKMLEQGFIK